MASIVKIKRSAVQGKAPTTSEIQAGELALNTRDGKLFSSTGTAVFEVGANLHSLSVGSGGISIANGALTFPTADSTSGYVLSTDGAGTLSFIAQVTGAATVGTNAAHTSNTKTHTAQSEVVVDTFLASAYRSAKYVVQVDDTDNANKFQTSELLLVHNGSATFMTEYGQVATSTTIATIDSDISGGSVRLKVLPTSTNTVVKVTRLALNV
jgi:hypothetical protein|tara:strand:+ start:4594 stop:5226 length:633 start_codon:yes stop_codon:yes gene_type:complete